MPNTVFRLRGLTISPETEKSSQCIPEQTTQIAFCFTVPAVKSWWRDSFENLPRAQPGVSFLEYAPGSSRISTRHFLVILNLGLKVLGIDSILLYRNIAEPC